MERVKCILLGGAVFRFLAIVRRPVCRPVGFTSRLESNT